MNKEKRVCMFVRNYFTNDARVTREAKSLIEAGFKVWVIAVYNEKDPSLLQKEVKEGINIIRVSRYGFWYALQNFLKALKQKFMRNITVEKKKTYKEMPWFCLILVVYHLFYALYNIVNFFPKSIRYVFTKLTDPYFKLFSGFTIITLKFIEQGLRVKAEVYHSHDLDTLLAGYVCSRIHKAKLVYDSHEIATDRENLKAKPFWRFLERLLIKKADRVIFTTYTRAKFSADKYRMRLPEVLSSFTDIPEEIRSIDLKGLFNIDRKFTIALYQGGIQSGRGLEQLIEAVPLLHRDIVIVLVGDGKLKPQLEEKVRLLGLTDRVKFIGLVPLRDLLSYTSCADVGLQILHNTCFNHFSTDSNKLFEYLAAGVPVVASDFPEIRKVIDEFDAGVLIDPHKPENIAQGINTLILDEARRKQMSLNAKKASLKYNWENEKGKLIRMYKSLDA
ncbi:MAG: glycosyltransferase family 4 protein [Candidatus Omnitrophica bacterium]|nr:glycosyltransferase family 4 protein [Candidatus Omnitrophota bacterium]